MSPNSSVAYQLLLGRFDQQQLMPYPEQLDNAAAAGDSMVAKTKSFCGQYLFPDRIDQHAMLPPGIVKGMGNIGVLGMTVDQDLGGTKMTAFNFCRVMEILGGHCGSTAAMVRLQSCVVLRLLQNWGTPQQQQRWMPGIIAGDQTGAVVITGSLAGLDVANIHTSAKLNRSGDGFNLKGEKHGITNGTQADVLIVLARTNAGHDSLGEEVTAFLVPADRQGVTIHPVSAVKLGLRGVSVASIELDNVAVASADLMGRQGDAIAMLQTVDTIDRISYAASLLGVMKFLLRTMVDRVPAGTQFGQSTSPLQFFKHKIAEVASNVYALEAAIYFVADLADGDVGGLRLEAQILSLFASESAWAAANAAMEVGGRESLFNDQPFERVLRNIRHGLIDDGSNDLLRRNIAAAALATIAPNASTATKFSGTDTVAWLKNAGGNFPSAPSIDVKHEYLRFHARWLAGHIAKLGRICRTPSEVATDQALWHRRVADLATNLFLCSCVFSKLSALMVNGTVADPRKRFLFDTGALFLHRTKEHNLKLLDQLKFNLDQDHTGVADHWLADALDDSHWPLGDKKTQSS